MYDNPKEVAKWEKIAEVAKEINDEIRKHFSDPPSTRPIPLNACQNASECDLDPKRQHEDWRGEKVVSGWKCGGYDEANKTHPNLCVKYEYLPFKEKIKDYIFWCVVQACVRFEKKQAKSIEDNPEQEE